MLLFESGLEEVTFNMIKNIKKRTIPQYRPHWRIIHTSFGGFNVNPTAFQQLGLKAIKSRKLLLFV
ncbi:hypothetical protein SAMN05444280_11412 [Tangfeifania diversioriginum]|uniref:Uncharacterized protein n=1 Tax=Tangfeifania diversioriginum TaxID=1168035 RepID=A0A1M6HMI6_9BACT|nr:hypothetical protein SAMN05444280_11412 [Tangfeifania diversioriginum]